MGLQVLDSTIPGPPGPKGDQGDVGPGVINWRGGYDNATAYTLNEAVSYQGSSYICIASTTGNLPTNTSFWNLLAQKGDTGATGATGAAGADGLDITWRGVYDNGTAYIVNDAVSYQGSSYICKSPTTGNVPTNATFWDLMASKGDTGSQGIQGIQGVQGAHGGAITIRYTISDQTGDTDPGNGVLRLDNFSTQNTATVIRADHVDADGIDWSSVLPTLDDSTSTIKGHIRLVNPADQSKWLLLTVAGVGSETGYKNINVTNVGSSGTNPFSNGQTVLLTFTRQGDKGDTGATGDFGADGLDITWRGAYDSGAVYAINDAVSCQGSSYIAIASTTGNLPTNASFWNLMAQKGDTGDQGPAGSNGVVGAHGGGISIQYTFDDTTIDSDPGNGLLRLSNSTQNAATVIRADHLDTNGTDWTSVLTSLDDSTSTNKGQIRLFKADDQSNWLLFNVTAVGSETGYKNITVSNVASSATSPFANGNSIVLAFTRTGDKGESGSQGTQGVQGDSGEDGLDITWRGAYDNGTIYAENDAVSYQGSSYIATASTTGNLPTNPSFWDLMAQKGDTGSAGSNGSNGSNGQHGGGITAEWEFDSTTTDSDPGAGKLRLSNSTQNASTVIRVDHLDFANTDWSAVLPTLDDSASTIKGHIRLVHRTDQSKWLLFTVSVVGSESGYKNVTVANVGSSASSPFANGDRLVVTFTRTGDKGDTGNTGSTGATGTAGAFGGAVTINYTFSTTTTDSDPGNGNLRLDNATQSSATIIRVDLLDNLGSDWTDAIDGMASAIPPPLGVNPLTGHIRLVHRTDLTKWILFRLDGVEDETGYRNLWVTFIDSSTTNPFSNSDQVVLAYSRNGIDGEDGFPGGNGSDGAAGGAITIQYEFSTNTTDSDPGNGILRLNQATQNTATVIRTDLLDILGTTWTTVLDSLDDSSSTIKGHIRLVHLADFSKWIVFSLSSVASATGYRNMTVSVVAASSSNPFTNGDPIIFTFTRQGDKGDAGSGASYDIQVFTSSGTWTKPAGAVTIHAHLIGGGGGGGSGARNADATEKGGGGGGGGGGYTYATSVAGSLSATEAVAVGGGGAQGAHQGTNNSSGNAGGAGGNSTFDSATANGGAGGGGGTSAAAGAGGTGGTGSTANGANGANGAFAGNAPAVSSTSNMNAGGGGGGGGGNDDPAIWIPSNGGYSGGIGGLRGLESLDNTSTGGVIVSLPGHTGMVGQLLIANHLIFMAGGGGGGGGGSSANQAASSTHYGFGGEGGRFGGGGGGGCGFVNNVSGFNAGGAGAQGVVIIITELS